MQLSQAAFYTVLAFPALAHAKFEAFMGYDPSIRINLGVSEGCMEAL